jgi:SpoVK/Ycf46/Vps4 family AAA+-type ATPase
VVNQLLIELDSVQGGQVAVVALTNRPELVDPALLRPGRLGTRIHVPLPDAEGRGAILRTKLAAFLEVATDTELDSVVDEVAARTEGLSGADLAAICDAARLNALHESGFARNVAVTAKHLDAASRHYVDQQIATEIPLTDPQGAD